MGRLARVIEEKGFLVEMFLPVQVPSHRYGRRKENGQSSPFLCLDILKLSFIDYVVSVPGHGTLKVTLD